MYPYDYLEHHGIKGQRWGVRRYQNPDGTLTEQGKKQKSNNDKRNKYIKYGAAATAGVLAIAGGYALQKHMKTKAMKDIVNKGNEVADKLLKEALVNKARAGGMGPTSAQMHRFMVFTSKANEYQTKSVDARKKAVDKANEVGKSIAKTSKYLLTKDKDRYSEIFK